MSQRSTSPLKRSTVRRTLRRFWDVTRTQPLIVFLSVFSSAGYIFLLTFANLMPCLRVSSLAALSI